MEPEGGGGGEAGSTGGSEHVVLSSSAFRPTSFGSENVVLSSSAFRPMPFGAVSGWRGSRLSAQGDFSADLPVPSLGSAFDVRGGLWQEPCRDGITKPARNSLSVQRSQGSFSLSPGDQGSFSVSDQSLPPGLHVQRSQGSFSLSPSGRGKRPGSASWGLQAGGGVEAEEDLSGSQIQIQVRAGQRRVSLPSDAVATATTDMDLSTSHILVHVPHTEGPPLQGLMYGPQPATMHRPLSAELRAQGAGAGGNEHRPLSAELRTRGAGAEGYEQRSSLGVECGEEGCSLPGSTLISNSGSSSGSSSLHGPAAYPKPPSPPCSRQHSARWASLLVDPDVPQQQKQPGGWWGRDLLAQVLKLIRQTEDLVEGIRV